MKAMGKSLLVSDILAVDRLECSMDGMNHDEMSKDKWGPMINTLKTCNIPFLYIIMQHGASAARLTWHRPSCNYTYLRE